MVKTYNQVIGRLGNTIFHNYMGGSNDYLSVSGTDLVAFIYEIPEKQVYNDAIKAYRKQADHYYQSNESL